MNYLMQHLNQNQQKAAEILTGPVLVLAGAGSGKTRTLTYRTANLVRQGVNPANILTVTFTNKAANDMQDKMDKLLAKEKTKEMWIGTFHSICLRILRKHIHKLNRSEGCLIYDTQDSHDIIEDIIFEFKLKEEDYDPRLVFNIIQKAKMELVNPESLTAKFAKNDQRSRNYYQVVEKIFREYERVLANNNSFDFNDLIKKTIELFTNNPEILKKYQNKFKYVQVDEYQDVNHSQYQITNLLAQPENNIFVVGDDWQGIYAFRGADISNILEFERDYPEAKIIKLERNYRSSNNIITVSNELIKNNKQNKAKLAWTDQDNGAPIFIAEAADPYIEANYIAKRIINLVNNYGYSYNDIAVLCRTHYQSYYIQRLFPKKRIPYQVIGGVSFFDRQEIRYLINYLKLIVNPEDQLALKRLFTIEVDGVGDVLLSEINKYARQNKMELTDVFENPTAVRGIGKKKGANVVEFKRRVLDKIYELRNRKMSIYHKVKELYEAIDFENNVLANLEDPQERVEYVNFFFEDLENYQKYNPTNSLYDYLLVNKLIGGQDLLEKDKKDQVKVMTAHAAKGLEFPVVFIVAAEEDVFPHQKSLEEQLSGQNQFAVEEERRLFYVAMTRAEKILFISFAKTKKQNFSEQLKQVIPSRFLYELPKEKLDLTKVEKLSKTQLRIKKDASILDEI